MKLKYSFSKRLSLNILLASALLAVVTIAILAAYSLVIVKGYVKEISEQSIKIQYENVRHTLAAVEGCTNDALWMVREHLDDPEYLMHICEEVVNSNEKIIGCMIGFEPYHFKKMGKYFAPYACMEQESHNIVCYQCGSDDYNYFETAWYAQAKAKGKEMWCEPYHDEDNEVHGFPADLVSYVVPLYDDSGEFIGVFGTDVSLEAITAELKAGRTLSRSYAFMIDSTGRFISYPNKKRILKSTVFDMADERNSPKWREIGNAMIAGKTASGITVRNRRTFNFGNNSAKSGSTAKTGNNAAKPGSSASKYKVSKYSLVSYAPLPNKWSIAVSCSQDDVMAPIRNLLWIMLGIGIIIIVVLYFVVNSIVVRVTTPITKFAFAALNIGKGNFNATIPEVQTQDEVKRLHDALAYMLKSINRYISELKTSMASNQRFESELNIAKSIQEGMVTRNFDVIPQADICAALTPAREVGGDLYDFLRRGNKLYFSIGDVSGKGVPAALYMAITRSALRFLANDDQPVDKIAEKVNNALCDGNSSLMFVTLFIGCIDMETGILEYCNAGHNPIVIISPEGKASFLHARPNIAAGIMPDYKFVKESVQLERGGRLCLYTDGVTEAETATKQQYGEERLLEFCSSVNPDLSSEEFIEKLSESVKKFTAGNEQNDDITIVSIKDIGKA